MEKIIQAIRFTRAVIVRSIFTREAYILSRSIKPISSSYGFDRGKPVDRFYIEKFLEQNKDLVTGACLEIVDDTYIVRYGGNKVTKGDVLDIFVREKTTIHGDLKNVRGTIADNTYDCIIITQTFNVIDNYEEAISECYRILKPGGTLLVTLPTISPAWNLKINLWRFTVPSAQYVFQKYFSKEKLAVSGFGNRLVAECFWLGMAVEDMKKHELEAEDKEFPLIIGVRATK